MPHSTKQVADFIGVSPQTIRQYCDEFGEYLSDSATPPKGETRRFTDSDRDTMYAIRELLASGMTYDAVRSQLERGIHRLEEYQPPPEEAGEETATALVTVDQLRAWTARVALKRAHVPQEPRHAPSR